MNHKSVVTIMSIIMIIGIIIGLGYMVYNGFNNEMSKVKNPELWTNAVEEETEESYKVILFLIGDDQFFRYNFEQLVNDRMLRIRKIRDRLFDYDIDRTVRICIEKNINIKRYI